MNYFDIYELMSNYLVWLLSADIENVRLENIDVTRLVNLISCWRQITVFKYPKVRR